MTKEEWEKNIIEIKEKIEKGELKDESWDDFIKNYVDYECRISHEFFWNYKGIDYSLYPLEEFGRYEYYVGDIKEPTIYKDIWDAIENIRIDNMSIKELYESNLIFFEIT